MSMHNAGSKEWKGFNKIWHLVSSSRTLYHSFEFNLCYENMHVSQKRPLTNVNKDFDNIVIKYNYKSNGDIHMPLSIMILKVMGKTQSENLTEEHQLKLYGKMFAFIYII